MKHFFKYEKGFVNIDAENLYLTQSGNWSETDSLSEKSKKSKSQNTKKKIKTYSFYAMLLSFSLLLFFNLNNGKNGKMMLPIGIILLFLSAYYYIRAASGSQYKIPFSKITKMEHSFNSLKIHFKNFDDKEDFERLDAIDKKGIQILKDLKLIK
ncbi:hypothetical protein FIA58_004860 [Flavobacterium jejuense]|uniref:Uncharacterized protein n=1 Tax=Flavobacterium jejuense TaxID=1544455 RepID=A0ABX0IR95_9FLAO|nr:hypothetical protein [Flavobacterium jejuense]NHN25003.1 hypothetical protein [Flavobacterium jejuense]